MRVIGRGSFGVVVLARDRVLDRLVAIKLTAPAARPNPDAADRFRREAHTPAVARHPNVVQIFDLKEHAQQWAMIMEYVPDFTLRTHIGRGDLAAAQRLVLVRDLGAALATGHGRGVLHRDIKPSNVLVDVDGRARLADFGMALLADPIRRSGQTAQAAPGTPLGPD